MVHSCLFILSLKMFNGLSIIRRKYISAGSISIHSNHETTRFGTIRICMYNNAVWHVALIMYTPRYTPLQLFRFHSQVTVLQVKWVQRGVSKVGYLIVVHVKWVLRGASRVGSFVSCVKVIFEIYAVILHTRYCPVSEHVAMAII